MKPPRLGLAISTLGRWEALGQLLDDAASQETRPVVVICDQSPASSSHLDQMLTAARAEGLDVSVVRTARGLSQGRNACVAAMPSDVSHVLFPNDTSRLAAGFTDAVVASLTREPDVTVLALVLETPSGPRNRFRRADEPFDRIVWGVIEPAMVVDRDAFVAVNGFSPQLGSGAPTPWQSGEGTDLLFRMHRTVPAFKLRWADTPQVFGPTELDGLSPSRRRRKLRAYGRGTGFVYRTWIPSVIRRSQIVVGPFARSFRSREFSLQEAFYLALGRCEGLAARSFSKPSDSAAVTE